MIVALYYASLILFIPGALIAVFFLTVERAAEQATLGRMLAGLWQALVWLYNGGFFVTAMALAALAALVAFLLVGGVVPRVRPYAAGLMLVLGAASLVTMLRIGGVPRFEEMFIPLCNAGSIGLSAIVLWQSALALTRETP